MNIYEIKQRTQETSPYFFTRKTLKFFGQSMRSFKLKQQPDGRTMISADMRDSQGTYHGQTVRYFNPLNNELEHK